MIVRTCLLISDDPDDHVDFSEALNETAGDAVLVSISDFKKALDLLTLKKCVPDFIFINFAISGFRPHQFLDTLQDDPLLAEVRIIAYGESEPVQSLRITAFLDHDLSYSELKAVLKNVMG